MSDGDDPGFVVVNAIDENVGKVADKYVPMNLVAEREHRRMSNNRLNGLIDRRLEAIRSAGISLEIPFQGVFVFNLRLGIERKINQVLVLPLVA